MDPLRRRRILTAAAAWVAALRRARAAAPQASWWPCSPAPGSRTPSSFDEALVAELRALGHQDGQTIELDAHYADYSAAQAQRLAAEIAARKPAVIVANGRGIEPAFRLSPAASRGVRPQRQSGGRRIRGQPAAPGAKRQPAFR